MNDERRLFMRAVLDGQLSEQYVTDKELNFLYRELWQKMLNEHLPQSAVLLH